MKEARRKQLEESLEIMKLASNLFMSYAEKTGIPDFKNLGIPIVDHVKKCSKMLEEGQDFSTLVIE